MKNQVQRYVAFAVFGFASLVAGWVLAVGLAVNPGGITFPDGTVQATATFNAASTHFVARASISLDPGSTGSGWIRVEPFDVREGEVGIIEYISGHCQTPFGNYLRRTGIAVETPDVSQYSFEVPMYYKGNDGDYAYYDAGRTTRIYVVHRPTTDAGELNVQVGRVANTGYTNCAFSFSGHYAPI